MSATQQEPVGAAGAAPGGVREHGSGAWIVHNARDNVATALVDLRAGDTVVAGGAVRLTLRQPIAFGHKFALRDIAPDEAILKYGETIGAASCHIAAGAHVHVHNLVSRRGRRTTGWKDAPVS